MRPAPVSPTFTFSVCCKHTMSNTSTKVATNGGILWYSCVAPTKGGIRTSPLRSHSGQHSGVFEQAGRLKWDGSEVKLMCDHQAAVVCLISPTPTSTCWNNFPCSTASGLYSTPTDSYAWLPRRANAVVDPALPVRRLPGSLSGGYGCVSVR